MNVLFVHNNFPAQFRSLAADLASRPENRVVAIGSQTAAAMEGVTLERYSYAPASSAGTHPFARRFETECRRAEQVLYAASRVAASGFVPDCILVHCGWGENLALRPVFPKARIVVYCEYYYQPTGGDVGFDPEDPPLGLDGEVALRAKNAATLLALAEADLGLSPTAWQRSTYPKCVRSKIKVVHEGVDVDHYRPNPDAVLALPSGLRFGVRDEVLTYVARSLEPMRGFRSFMRALPAIQAARPALHTVIIGGEDVSYGAEPTDGRSWKQHMLAEVGDRLDPRRTHFLGRVPPDVYLAALQVSTAHVYLTAPFVLSWSLLEAMSVGCRIIASDTPPVREVVNAGNGVLVPFFDVEAIAAIVSDITRIAEKNDTSVPLSAQARATIRSRYERPACLMKTHNLMSPERFPLVSQRSA